MSEPLSQGLTHIDILVLALFSLGGDGKSIDTEDIAVRAAELAPGRFSWRSYPEQISLESVRRNLGHAGKAENGSVIAGSAKLGWHLTPSGLRWAQEHRSLLQDGFETAAHQDKERSRRRNLAVARIVDLPAWRKYASGEGVNAREARAVFRLSEYTTRERRELMIDRQLALVAGDDEFEPFMTAMAVLARTDEGASNE